MAVFDCVQGGMVDVNELFTANVSDSHSFTAGTDALLGSDSSFDSQLFKVFVASEDIKVKVESRLKFWREMWMTPPTLM